VLKAYSHSLDTAAASSDALEDACQPFGGQAPDAVFTCAGASKPMFFVEMDEKDMINGMTNGYWVQAWTAFVSSYSLVVCHGLISQQAAAKKMAKQHRKGAKIIFVSSTLGYMSFVGWASYAPAKHALRGEYPVSVPYCLINAYPGLADTLHSEMMLYEVDVHIFFPPTMFTPGFDEENKTKPDIVKKIESADEGLTADQAALALFKGVESGHIHITGDMITNLFRVSTRGATPKHNWFLDGLFDMVAFVSIQ